MSPPIKSLLWGFLIGVFLSTLAWYKLPHKDIVPPLDPRPYQDSIRVAEREKKLAQGRSAYHIRRADSLQAMLRSQNRKKRQHDIKTIEGFTPDSRRLWLDSVSKSAGLQ